MAYLLVLPCRLLLSLMAWSRPGPRNDNQSVSTGGHEPYWLNEDDLDEWSVYLDLPHVTQQNRWFLDRCFNLPTVKK
jgi:hypothetical protein